MSRSLLRRVPANVGSLLSKRRARPEMFMGPEIVMFRCAERRLALHHVLFAFAALAMAWIAADPLQAADTLQPADTPPRIIGLARVEAARETETLAAGQLLLGELNCTSCHQIEAADRNAANAAALADEIVRKPAPVLDAVGSRVRPEYLRRFLTDPQATKPGTTMPHVLAGHDERQRTAIVESLVHFLATTGRVTEASPLRLAVDRGERLFHAVGCVACHDARKEEETAALPTSIPLGTPSHKYTLPALAQFLLDPLAVRPGGRMPQCHLNPAEARDIASYLLNDLDVVSGLQYAYYEGTWDKLPNFSKLTPVQMGEATDFHLSMPHRRDHFAVRFEGTIELKQEGEYLFLVGCDDGARLLIDDKPVVVADGVHPYEQKRKKQKMAAGTHSVIVEYFQQQGDVALQVEFELPGMPQQPLASLLAVSAKTKAAPPSADAFAVDPQKAAQGRAFFASLGCASCHALRVDGQAVAATFAATPLARLGTRGGCLDDHPAKAPRYALSSRQKKQLAAAIAAAKLPAAELTADEQVRRTLVRFNCIACHARGELGGVETPRNRYFESDMPEMGDEGRLPPHLAGVGAKLTRDWMQNVCRDGAKDRPYMFTRMPKFGGENLASLPAALEAADAHLMRAAPHVAIPPGEVKRYKAAGRRLVGAQGFSCIKCHTFAGRRSTGIQALSLTTMTRRLRPDWFHYYVQNPLAYRPGTRMPTSFPDGQTTLPKVLDGTVNGQIAAIWSYLADGDKATLPTGLVTGKIELIAFDEAVIYRNFLDGVGPRGIGVGYPEKLNLAFDANDVRLAMLWQGAFIDAARHWTGRGAGFEKPLGDNVVRLPEGPPLATLATSAAPWPASSPPGEAMRFGGYRLAQRRQPVFLYHWRGATIEDEPQPVGEEDLYRLRRTISIRAEKPMADAWFRAMRADKIEELASGSFKIDDRWLLTVAGSAAPLRREQAGAWEIIVPLELAGGEARIELTYDW